LLPELQSMASSLGISGTARLRKGELIAAIQEQQSGEGRVPGPRNISADAPERRTVARADAPRTEVRAEVREDSDRAPAEADRAPARAERADRAERTSGDRATGDRANGDRANGDRASVGEREPRGDREPSNRRERSDSQRGNDRSDGPRSNDRSDNQRGDNQRGDSQRSGDQRGNDQRGGNHPNNNANNDDDDEGGRRGRRSRFRDRNRRGGTRERGEGEGGGQSQRSNEPQVNDDDVLVPVAGIVDVLDNYAFVRTSGYLAGANDVYVSMAQIKRYGLRRGDAVTGAVRAARDNADGSRRDKYNPLVRLDTINGMDMEESRRRPEFYKLTPLYPQERLRLETEPHILTTRVIDLVMPIGKGQRALIVSPPKAGKTMVLQSIANAIAQNNPECHLMVVLVDERPEEVTDMQRSVKGEVIASTFDRPPSDHTTVAELSIERAKRLVELGHDVVVLLDSITRLGRAYNNSSPASGRILSGGIDSTALYPPKRFLGAARNIEHGGSLTIIATALVETGSTGDTVIFEEFKGTGNAELKLDRKIADKRVFPAIDIDPSSTRKEEILLAPDEMAIVLKLRKVLHALDSQQALDLLLDRLKKTRTNIEFLMQIAQSTPGE
jgi:transcription termination factor Rho